MKKFLIFAFILFLLPSCESESEMSLPDDEHMHYFMDLRADVCYMLLINVTNGIRGVTSVPCTEKVMEQVGVCEKHHEH